MAKSGEVLGVLDEIKRDMTERWGQLIQVMELYETHLDDSVKKELPGESLTELGRLRKENEELRLKVRTLESKWKTYRDESLRKEMQLQKKVQNLEASNKRLKENVAKLKESSLAKPTGAKRKKELGNGDNEDNAESDDSIEPVVKKLKDEPWFLSGARKRKPAFSHLKGEYAIDIKGIDQKMLDKDDDIAGVAGADDGEVEDTVDEDDDTFCRECSRSFTTINRLRAHLRSQHGVLNPSNTFSCEKCDLALTSAVAYNRHMKYLHGQDEKPHTCEVCQVSFATEANLQSHLDNKVHEKKTAAISVDEPGETIVILQPPKKNINQKRNICPLCFMVFPTSSEMSQHMLKHRRTKGDATFACDACEEVFYKKSALIDHETRCPKKEKTEDEKLWESIDFPEPVDVLREQLNYQDESLIDPELGPTEDYQEAVAPADTICIQAERASAGQQYTLTGPARKTNVTVSKSLLANKCPTGNESQMVIMESSGDAGGDHKGHYETIVIHESAGEKAHLGSQYETISIVNEEGQSLGQAQVSVDPNTGEVTYMAVSENGEQIPLSQIMGEGADPSELLLSIINAKSA